MTYRTSLVSPSTVLLWTYQSWRSKGGSQLYLVSRGVLPHQGAYIPEFGRIHPADEIQYPSLGRHLVRPALKPQKLWGSHVRCTCDPVGLLEKALLSPSASLPAMSQSPAEPPLPVHNLGPGAFVQKIVDSHHGLDGVFGSIIIAFPQHSIIHLLWRRIFPICLGVASGY